jgi:hypothetical protein
VADVVKESKIIRDVLDTVGEISKLLKYSPRRDSLFELLKSSLSPAWHCWIPNALSYSMDCENSFPSECH